MACGYFFYYRYCVYKYGSWDKYQRILNYISDVFPASWRGKRQQKTSLFPCLFSTLHISDSSFLVDYCTSSKIVGVLVTEDLSPVSYLRHISNISTYRWLMLRVGPELISNSRRWKCSWPHSPYYLTENNATSRLNWLSFFENLKSSTR